MIQLSNIIKYTVIKKTCTKKASLVASGLVLSSKGKFLGDLDWYAIHRRG